MVDFAALRSDSSTLLGQPVQAAALVVLDIGRVAPTAGGVAGAVAGDAASSLVGLDNTLVDGLATGVGFVGGKHAVYQGAADASGLTPVMVLAVTNDEYVLMNWDGNVRWGTGPSTVFARFLKSEATVTDTTSGPTHHLVLRQGDVEIKVQCNAALFSPGKKETRELLSALGVS